MMESEVLAVQEDAPRADEVSRPARPPRAPSTPPRRRPLLLVPALLTGGLLWLCYFPVAWGWLAWVALVPLLCLVRAEARPWRLFFCAWAGGLVFFWAALQWMRVAD